MNTRVRLVSALIGATGMLIPFLGAQTASAATTHSGSSGKEPTCVVHTAPYQVESGLGETTSSIADVITVECKPAFSEQTVEISSPQLNGLCNDTLSWYSDSTPETEPGGWGYGESFNVVLDDDGNANAVVWGGPSCAAGRALITADLAVAPYTTARTHFTVEPPESTKEGVTAVPASEVEDATYSGVATVINVEFNSVYSEDTVEVSSPQLYNRCHGNLTWYGPDETVLGTDEQSVTTTLDDDGNAFVVAVGGPSCATGSSQVTADLEAPPHTTLSTNFKILEPQPTV